MGWHDSFEKLHPPAPRDCVLEDEEEQTYAEFKEMGKREPNEQGTGRNKLIAS